MVDWGASIKNRTTEKGGVSMILASEQLIKEWTSKGAWIEKTLIDYFKGHETKRI